MMYESLRVNTRCLGGVYRTECFGIGKDRTIPNEEVWRIDEWLWQTDGVLHPYLLVLIGAVPHVCCTVYRYRASFGIPC